MSASAVAVATPKKLRHVVSEVGQPGRGSAGGGGGGFGVRSDKGSGRVVVSSSLGGRLAPVTERAISDPTSDRVVASGGGSAAEGAASVLPVVHGDGDDASGGGGGSDSVGKRGYVITAVTALEGSRARQRAAAGGSRDVEEDEAQEGRDKAISPGGELSISAETDGSDGGGGGGGREEPVPSGADDGKARNRNLGRGLSGSTGTTGGTVSPSPSSGGHRGGEIGGGGRRKDEDWQEGEKAGDGAPQRGPGGNSAGEEANKKDEEDQEEEKEEVLVRKTLCPALEPELLDVAFKIFDLDNSGTVTKEVQFVGVDKGSAILDTVKNGD